MMSFSFEKILEGLTREWREVPEDTGAQPHCPYHAHKVETLDFSGRGMTEEAIRAAADKRAKEILNYGQYARGTPVCNHSDQGHLRMRPLIAAAEAAIVLWCDHCGGETT